MRAAQKLKSLFLTVLSIFCGVGGCNENETACDREGNTIYMEECAICHGIYGTGGPSAGLKGDGLKESWTQAVRTGKGEMAEWGETVLDETDMAILMDFLVDNTVTPEGDLLYRQQCASCHGFSPDKGGNGPALTGNGLHKEWMDTTKNGTSDGRMISFVAELCDADLESVVHFVIEGESLIPDAGALRTDTESPQDVTSR